MTLTKPNWLEISRIILLSRHLDQLEEEQLTPQGIVKYQFSAMGHELAQVLLAQALDHSHDAATVYYRSRPFMLASGLTPVEALSAGMALTNNPSEGRDVGATFNLPRRSGPLIFPMSGNVGTQYTPATGWAQAVTYRSGYLGEKSWEGAIAVAFGGDASVATNGFWSMINIATTLCLPVLMIIENNNYGISVPAIMQTPGGNIAANLSSFQNLLTLDGDGTDPVETWDLIKSAISHTRSGKGPCLLHLNVPRLRGHTFIDNQAYKSPEELENERLRDPIPRLRQFLDEKNILSTQKWDQLVQDVTRDLNCALDEAMNLPEPDSSQIKKFVFFEGDIPIHGGLRPEEELVPMGPDIPQSKGPRQNIVDAVRQTLEFEMSINSKILVYGEDVGVKGGVHGATMGMQRQFGKERVFDTSLSEEGIIGRSIGMAMAGLLPVPEIQFRKYTDPAHEQLNDIGWIRWRTANKFAAPMVVRIPVGYGKITGDPWHSFSGEAFFAHMIGWRIAFPSNAEDAVGLLRFALRYDDPTIFLEHRALLDTSIARRPYPGNDYCLPFGRAASLTEGDSVTVITWGAMVHRCLEASKEFPKSINLIDLRTLAPWDKETVIESVRNTGKVLVVHEDTHTGGFAGEIIATIVAEAFTYLDAPIQRLTTPDIPIPYNVGAMNAVVPSVESIKTKIKMLIAY